MCMTISLLAEKANKILDCCHCLLLSQSIILWNLASLLGLLESSRHLASSTTLIVRSDKGPTNEPGVLWCFDCPATECESRTCLVVEHTLNTNSSPVHLPPLIWSSRLSLQHIKYLELKASFFGFINLSQRQVSRNHISAFRKHDRHRLHQQQRGLHVPPTYDSDLRDVGWCQTRDILAIASHIPERDISESREFKYMSEWKLDSTLLNCQTDLFASHLTNRPVGGPTQEPSTQMLLW